MTGVSASECRGLWRRTLLVTADGGRDSSTDVVWLQGVSAFVDTRGFAGRLRQHGDVFEWIRDIDPDPGPHPDAGSMRWDGQTLIETGVHEDYTEHWVRDDETVTPAGALFLAGPDGGAGLLMRVGERFGWAAGTRAVVDAIGSWQWTQLAVALSETDLRADGVRWTVKESEGVMSL